VNGLHVNVTVTVSFLLRGVMQFSNNDIIVSHQPLLLPTYPLTTFYYRGFKRMIKQRRHCYSIWPFWH